MVSAVRANPWRGLGVGGEAGFVFVSQCEQRRGPVAGEACVVHYGERGGGESDAAARMVERPCFRVRARLDSYMSRYGGGSPATQMREAAP